MTYHFCCLRLLLATSSQLSPSLHFSILHHLKLYHGVIFGKKITLMKNDIEIDNGHFDTITNLFWIKTNSTEILLNPPITPTQVHPILVDFVHTITSKKDLATFYHCILSCSAKSTYIKALLKKVSCCLILTLN